MDRPRVVAVTAASTTAVYWTNDPVRVGLIGCGGRGQYIGNFMRQAMHIELLAFRETNAETARVSMEPSGRDYGDFRKLLENRGIDAVLIGTPGQCYYNMSGDTNRPLGETYYGSNGTVFCERIGYEVYFENGKEPPVRKNTTEATSVPTQHFVAGIRGTEKQRPTVLTGHRATITSHLGNLAAKLGKKIPWDTESERITGESAKILRRDRRAPWGKWYV